MPSWAASISPSRRPERPASSTCPPSTPSPHTALIRSHQDGHRRGGRRCQLESLCPDGRCLPGQHRYLHQEGQNGPLLQHAHRLPPLPTQRSSDRTKMDIAVVDAGANLKAFVRMDDAFLGSIDISIKKARTARFFNMPTVYPLSPHSAHPIAPRWTSPWWTPVPT